MDVSHDLESARPAGIDASELSWLRIVTPITEHYCEIIARRDYRGKRLAYWGHITFNVIPMMLALQSAGAEIAMGACNVDSTDNATAAYLSVEVIAELIKLAEEMREAGERGEHLNLTEDEIAFYDLLEVNDSAVKVLGDEMLKGIARELVETVCKNVTIDGTVREAVRARLRVKVKRILRKYGYPPDKQGKATQTVLEQAELIAADWAE